MLRGGAAVALDDILQEPLFALLEGLQLAQILEPLLVVARCVIDHRGVHLADVLGMVRDCRPVQRRADAQLQPVQIDLLPLGKSVSV